MVEGDVAEIFGQDYYYRTDGQNDPSIIVRWVEKKLIFYVHGPNGVQAQDGAGGKIHHKSVAPSRLSTIPTRHFPMEGARAS